MTSSENEHKWPEPPEHLSEKAKELFSFYVGRSVRAPGQIALFLRGLEAMDQADECGRIIREEGLSKKSERSKIARQHPLLNTQRQATGEFLKIWKLLNLQTNLQLRISGGGYERIV